MTFQAVKNCFHALENDFGLLYEKLGLFEDAFVISNLFDRCKKTCFTRTFKHHMECLRKIPL